MKHSQVIELQRRRIVELEGSLRRLEATARDPKTRKSRELIKAIEVELASTHLDTEVIANGS